jgi:hypothetical protein
LTSSGNATAIQLAAPKKKHTLLPLLTIVFLGSYVLMTLLIVLQGDTIQAQRNLIQILMSDSRELWSLKGKALVDKAAQARALASPSARNAPSHPAPTQVPSTETPSTQTPSTQAPSAHSPSTQVPQRHSQSRAGKGAKPDTQAPPMPASDLGDQRRALITL